MSSSSLPILCVHVRVHIDRKVHTGINKTFSLQILYLSTFPSLSLSLSLSLPQSSSSVSTEGTVVGSSLSSLKDMAAQAVAATSSHGVSTSSSGFPHIDSKPEMVDQTLRRKIHVVLCVQVCE